MYVRDIHRERAHQEFEIIFVMDLFFVSFNTEKLFCRRGIRGFPVNSSTFLSRDNKEKDTDSVLISSSAMQKRQKTQRQRKYSVV